MKKRLDILLTGVLTDTHTRSQITNLIKNGCVTVNGKVVTKAGTEVTPADIVNVLMDTSAERTSCIPEDIKIDIVFEDEHLMIINKPRGMVVHPGAGNKNGTLLNGLLYLIDNTDEADEPDESDKAALSRAGIVHRLDKNTAGLMVVAKTAPVQAKLAAMLEKHEIERVYHGIVEGAWEGEGSINKNIIRDPKHRTLFTTKSQGSAKQVLQTTATGGRTAITHYKVLKAFKKHSLVEFRLETGRTHQIRVHAKSAGHPLIGDPEYNPNSSVKASGQMLESISISFIHPVTGKGVTKKIDTTDEFKHVLSKTC